MRRSRKKGNRAFVISFALVFGVLAVSSAALIYSSSQIPVNHLPSKIPAYSALWAKYVPADYLQMGFENYSMTRSVDPSVPPATTALRLINPDINVSSSQITSLLTVTLSAPNATVEVAFLNKEFYDSLSATHTKS